MPRENDPGRQRYTRNDKYEMYRDMSPSRIRGGSNSSDFEMGRRSFEEDVPSKEVAEETNETKETKETKETPRSIRVMFATLIRELSKYFHKE
jgi:hypothetical protein